MFAHCVIMHNYSIVSNFLADIFPIFPISYYDDTHVTWNDADKLVMCQQIGLL